MKIVEVNNNHVGNRMCCINCPDGAYPLNDYGLVINKDGKYYCENNSGSSMFIVTHVIVCDKQNVMKGFIEVTCKKEPTTELINLNRVESFTRLNEGCLIHFGINNTLTVQESYEEIKELIKKAQ